jgi:hypothetical protein
MRDHIKILGILNIVLGSLTAIAGLIVLVVFGGLAGLMHSTMGLNTTNDGFAPAPILAIIGFGISIFLLVLSAPAIIGGIGLMRFRPWSRVLMIIVSVFHCFHIPIGTALGVYGFWVLFNPEAQRILDSGGHYMAPAPGYAGFTGTAPGSYSPPPPPPRV